MKKGKEYILTSRIEDQKQFHLDTKIKSTTSRTIQGFASTRFPDRANEIVDPKGLADAMNLYMQNPLVLKDHCQTTPIGKTVGWGVSPDGLQVTIEIISGTVEADEAWAEIQQGVRRALSIGFIPRVVDYTDEYPIIKELELLEISVVTIPCNRESLFSVVKAFNSGTDLIDKQMPKIGWDKTKAQLLDLNSVLKLNFAALPIEEKIFVESICKEIQTTLNSDSIKLELHKEIESFEAEMEILELESELGNLQ